MRESRGLSRCVLLAILLLLLLLVGPLSRARCHECRAACALTLRPRVPPFGTNCSGGVRVLFGPVSRDPLHHQQHHLLLLHEEPFFASRLLPPPPDPSPLLSPMASTLLPSALHPCPDLGFSVSAGPPSPCGPAECGLISGARAMCRSARSVACFRVFHIIA